MSLVTVCIATFNRASLLQKTVRSVQTQNYQNLEICIVDDCSTDNTKVVVEEIMSTDPRVVYLRHQDNKGLAAARNTAIKNASGKFFTFIDDDDAWEGDVVEKFVSVAQDYDDTWCFCCGYVSYENGNTVRHHMPLTETRLEDFIMAGWTPPVAGQFYFTSTIKNVGGYNEALTSGIDHDLWLRLACRGVNIRTLYDCFAVPNVMDANKITLNEPKRRKGIEKALTEWQAMIERCFGEEFYHHFVRCYRYYLDKRFLAFYVRDKNLRGIVSTLLMSPYRKRLLAEGIRALTVADKGLREREMEPLFAPFDRCRPN